MVNQQFNFALHIMAVLAFAPSKVVDSTTLATSLNTNPVVVRRLLLALRAARLVKTYAGKHGGAQIGKRPAQITLLDIYDAVEPRSVIAVSKRKAFRYCPVSCNMKHIMRGVAETTDQAVRKHLRRITLNDVVGQIR